MTELQTSLGRCVAPTLRHSNIAPLPYAYLYLFGFTRFLLLLEQLLQTNYLTGLAMQANWRKSLK